MLDLFEKRLLVVTGKGGVGKSVVAAALAHLASRQGKNVLLVEMDTEDRLGDLFETTPIRDKIVPVRENVSGVALSPRTVMGDFFRSHVKVKAVYGPILDSRLFNYFFDAAPALRELVCMGKLWRLVEEKSWWSQKPKWDLVVFDAPATGHGLGLLGVPESASHILLGAMKASALKIRDMLRDPAITALNIVTLPEEMPVNEAVMLYRGARDELRMPFGCLFLNSVFPERFSASEARELAARAGDDALALGTRAAFGPDGGPAAAALLDATRFEVERGALSTRYRKEVRDRIDLPAIEIPYLHTERFGFAEVDKVASVIEASLAARRVPA
jgi:anion-transporting  ArsA/GET3 family ATPase